MRSTIGCNATLVGDVSATGSATGPSASSVRTFVASRRQDQPRSSRWRYCAVTANRPSLRPHLAQDVREESPTHFPEYWWSRRAKQGPNVANLFGTFDLLEEPSPLASPAGAWAGPDLHEERAIAPEALSPY